MEHLRNESIVDSAPSEEPPHPPAGAAAPSMLPQPSWEHLLHPVRVRELARAWLVEDTSGFDYGGFVVGEKCETARLICKGRGVLAGRSFFDAVFRELDCVVRWEAGEGEGVVPGTCLATVEGKVRHLLLGERPALNCLSRACGIATQARDLSLLARGTGWAGHVAGTRKTTPGFRLVEKYALLVGGVATHRYDLSAMVMLKDNHIWSAGSITKAVQDARQACGFSTKIEVECRSLTESLEAAAAGADCVMLDNFTPQALHETAGALKLRNPSLLIEASGGITPPSLPSYLGPHIDVVSLGGATHSCPILDLSLKIASPGRDPLNPLVDSIL